MEPVLPKGHIDKRTEGASDYERIYREGIDILQILSGANWTDYNEHDPGVTVLENISYALTNLSYKADLPMKDILRSAKGDTISSGDNAFFVPSEILTTAPITTIDYRKLFIDNIRNFKNAFIKVRRENSLLGLYDIYVEMYRYSEDAQELQQEKERVQKEVAQLFHAHRNLCEDLYRVTILEPYHLALTLKVTLAENANGEETFAKIYFAINDHLTHEVRFASLADLQQQQVSINSIFEGPMLENGFIQDAELQSKKKAVYPDELMKLASKIEGVISIDYFRLDHVSSSGETIRLMQPTVHLLPHQFPILKNPDEETILQFKQEDVRFTASNTIINKQLSYMDMLYYGEFKSVSKAVNNVEIPKGTALEIDSYFPIREQFPLVYGIGEHGLEKRLSKKRYAQANQLKAFLLPFDQLMVNFLAQLNNVYYLYNTDENIERTYFTGTIEDMHRLIPLIKKEKEKLSPKILERWSEEMTALGDSFDTNSLKRMHQIADMLLARFSETYPTNALEKINEITFGAYSDHHAFDKKILQWKRELLKNYQTISYNRSKGVDYTKIAETVQKPTSETFLHSSVPGLVQKVSLLLGIENYKTRPLSDVVEQSGIKMYLQKDGVDFLSEIVEVVNTEDETNIIEVDEAIIINDLEEDLKNAFYFLGSSDGLFEEILREGIKKEHYRYKTNGASEKSTQHVFYKTKRAAPQLIHTATSAHEARTAIDRMIAALKQINRKSEGFHLIEHLLLVPDFTKEHFSCSFIMQVDDCTAIKFSQQQPMPLEKRQKFLATLQDQNSSKESMVFCIEPSVQEHTICIQQDGETLATSETFAAETDAQQALDAILCTFEEGGIPYSIHSIENVVHFGNNQVEESFFSLQMSLILPSWPARFQNENFRTKFNHTMAENAPAHIGFHTFYPPYNDMVQFEEVYFKWLELLPNKHNESSYADTSFELITLLKHYHETYCHD
ncbi:MAG TPA: hypothetical protein EYN07_07935 [Flavobacteriaceae bacterium]|nr:hypothetical protein [Flavobacteriaceae bacterium]HIN99155.1 hypothetical protein [Flavobacteriaceae bacterium]